MCYMQLQEKKKETWTTFHLKWAVPTVGLGVFLIFKISGRGIIDPDASIPRDTLTLVPSSRYLTPTLQGFLHQ